MMAAFNSMPTLSSNGPDALGLSHGGPPLEMNAFGQDLGFDDSLLEGVNHGLPPLPFTPSYDFETFSVATFEDPFSSYATRPYDAVAPDGTDAYHGEEESSPQELDNKLLGFSAPIHKASIVVDDSAGAPSDPFADQAPSVDMSAELLGMFFVAEDVFGGENNPSRPLELTCYRRNLWNCSGTITLPRCGVSAVLNENGQRIPVSELAASITAMESIESKAAEIISIPWKGTGGGGGEEGKVGATAPPQVPLDLGSGQEMDGNRVSVPVSWKRLQFKHATANNGRRKGLQQHYVVQINLLGKTEAGEYIKISEIQSGPVIVRGRSPRNFDSKRDVPVTAEKPPKLERRLTNEPATPSMLAVGPMNGVQDLAPNVQRYHALGNIQSTDWMTGQVSFGQVSKSSQLQQQQQQHPSKKLAVSPNLTRPPVPAWSSDSSYNAIYQHQQQQASQKAPPATPSHHMHQRQSLPINLSLSEDERSPNNRSNSTSDPLQSPSLDRKVSTGILDHNPNGSPLEDAEMLYEYFPLSLDDWMPPVDAIYRPHVVHHTVIPPEVKAQQTRSKTKRYFAAD